MPGFAKVEASADFSALEREVLQFWDAERIFEQRRALNAASVVSSGAISGNTGAKWKRSLGRTKSHHTLKASAFAWSRR